jgi:ABC-2 type transport system ATP-binding protein
VSFSISKGEVVGFLGPNGAGKSTMMKILTCYIPPSEGKIGVCGFDVLEDPVEVRQKVGYLPEHNPLYPDMYVREYLDFVAGIHRVPNRGKRVEEMVEMVGLTPERHKKIGQLSKGYRQRVGLAQAMIHNPEVLILDEPTSGLDPNQLRDIRSLILQIGKEKTVMLSTHIMQEVEAMCNRTIIINRGSIVADRPTAELRSAGSRPGLVVESAPGSDADVFRNLRHAEKVELLGPNRWLIEGTDERAMRQEVLARAAERGVDIISLSRHESSLEDVFKALTRQTEPQTSAKA